MKEINFELEVLKELVSYNTDSITKSYYTECASSIKRYMEIIGLKTYVFDGNNEAKDGISRPIVIGKLDTNSNKTILLLTHYDVVPAGFGWKKEPFKLSIEENKAFGRGTADDKGCIATALGALKDITNCKYNVLLACVPEEEIGGKYGAGYLVKILDEKIDEVLVLDAGNEFVGIGASGVVFGEIKVYGIQGHAGYPFRYINAAHEILRLGYHLIDFATIRARKISRFDAPPTSPIQKNFGRFSITIINVGQKENVIPGEGYIRFDMRLIPEEDLNEAINELKTFIISISNKLGIRSEITWIEGGGNYYTDPENQSVKKFVKIASEVYNKDLKVATELGGNDGRYFAKLGIPIISFGLAREDTRYHGPDEFVYLDDIIKLKQILIKYLTT